MCPSYEAKAKGVESAMGIRRALRLCPDAVVVRPRLSARREAKAMAGRWHQRVVDAELVRFERSFFGRVLKRVGLSRVWVQRGSVGRGLVFDMAWVLVSRRTRPRQGGGAVAFVVVLAVITALVLIAQS